MKNHFIELFEYTRSSNSKVIGLIGKFGSTLPEKTWITFSHMLNAHHVWNARIQNQQEKYKIWEEHPTEQLDSIDLKNYEDSLKILESKSLYSLIDYKTSKGLAFQNIIKDILFHIVNHSTYHRGQVIARIREAGFEPVSTDYIFFKR